MNVITNIIKKMDKERNTTNNTKQNAMSYIENETIDFDSNNILQSINAGEAKVKKQRTNVIKTQESTVNIENIDKAVLNFEFVNDPDMMKNINNLKNEIDHASQKWGIPQNLIAAIISQEGSGGTSSDNIMQIEFKSHHDEIKKVYDFEQKRIVSLVLTNDVNNPNYKNVDYKITESDLKNKKTAISIGTALLANCMSDLEYNIPLSIQEYNLGYGGIRKVINETARAEGYSATNSIYDEQTNMDFTKHTEITGNGDPNYVKNVVKYLNIYNNGKDSSIVTVNGYNPYTKEEMTRSVNFVPSSRNN